MGTQLNKVHVFGIIICFCKTRRLYENVSQIRYAIYTGFNLRQLEKLRKSKNTKGSPEGVLKRGENLVSESAIRNLKKIFCKV